MKLDGFKLTITHLYFVISTVSQLLIYLTTYRDSSKTFIELQHETKTAVTSSSPNPGAYLIILTTYARVSSLF